MIMKRWVGNAHGDQGVRASREEIVGRFDFRIGTNVQQRTLNTSVREAKTPTIPVTDTIEPLHLLRSKNRLEASTVVGEVYCG